MKVVCNMSIIMEKVVMFVNIEKYLSGKNEFLVKKSKILLLS